MSELLEHRTWAVVDDSGYLLDLYEDASLGDALATASGWLGDEVVLDSIYEVPTLEPSQHALAANAVTRLAVMQRKSLKACEIKPIKRRDVERLTVEEAHAKIVRFFPTERRGGAVVKWQDPWKMVGTKEDPGILRDNMKQQKPHPRLKSLVSTGLPLAPNAISFHKMPPDSDFKTPGPTRRHPQGDQASTFCVGSNEFCRGSCLVYTGQHGADPYNLELKAAASVALVEEPAAFMRILCEAIHVFGSDARQCRQRPCYRLNVLSDLPWELIYRPLFDEHFARDTFYDYTKVAGREVPENYDLTFSYSGTNWQHCKRELERGLRCAVVFLARRDYEFPFPATYRGYDVIDGTTHDFRFADPPGVVVGLRYKTPNTQLLASSGRMAKALAARSFLVPCWLDEAGVPVAAETPRQTELFWYERV